MADQYHQQDNNMQIYDNDDIATKLKQRSTERIRLVLIGIALVFSLIAVGIAAASLHELKNQKNQQTAYQPGYSMKQNVNTNVASLPKLIEDKLSNLTNLFHLLYSMQSTQDLIRACSAGVKDGRVGDFSMNASSSASWDGLFGRRTGFPHQGRLDYVGRLHVEAPSWAPKLNEIGEWIQVDFTSPTKITGVVTQGGGKDRQQWVTSFKISYSNSLTSLQTIQYSNGTDIIFPGNEDGNTYVMNKFPQPITARYFRLYPQTWNNHIALRLDYLNC